MKKICIFIVVVFAFLILPLNVNASQEVYDELFDALSPDSQKLLSQFGITPSVAETFSEISPEKAINAVFSLFRDGIKKPLSSAMTVIGILFTVTLVSSFIDTQGTFFMMAKSISVMCIVFSVLNTTSKIFTECSSSLLVTKDFMLVLIPAFAGIVAAAGNPALAISFNTVAFSFAETVALLFESTIPVVLSVLIAVFSAGVINPLLKFQGIGKTLSKALTLFMAFFAGIFVAVLSIRGVIAGAADSVTVRGVRFLIGNTVPVVGSAIGEALNSVIAGIGLIKNTVGVIGIAAVTVINLPCVINVIIWKGALFCISVCADVFENGEVKSFTENMSSILSVIIGAVIFTAFVFIISIAILITVRGS